jgi:hypothetical protein
LQDILPQFFGGSFNKNKKGSQPKKPNMGELPIVA